MTAYKVVVDGSNIATEGRSLPSLAQLDEAVRAFIEEHPGADVLVIVDSSFPNRIDAKEVNMFESAYNAGEIITPPAGTIGRGDSFILKVADKLGATIFSNDSFQEFHGTYDWLFDTGRLVGGKPIPGLGWVFMPRTPVRGPKSREAVRESKRSMARIGSPEAMKPMPVPKAPPPSMAGKKDDAAPRRNESRGPGRGDAAVRVREARSDDQRQSVPASTADSRDAREGRGGKRRRRRGGGGIVATGEGAAVATALNEPMTFLTFVAGNLVGSTVEGTVDTYSSHGFYVASGNARCYVQLSGVAVPTPRSAKEIVRKGDVRLFVVVGFDSERRGIELALVGTPGALAVTTAVSGSPSSDVVVDDNDDSADVGVDLEVLASPAKRGRRKGARADAAAVSARPALSEAPKLSAKTKGRRASVAVDVAADGAGVSVAETAVLAPAKVAAPAKSKRTSAVPIPESKAVVATKQPSKRPVRQPSVAPGDPSTSAEPVVKAPSKRASVKVATTPVAPTEPVSAKTVRPTAAKAASVPATHTAPKPAAALLKAGVKVAKSAAKPAAAKVAKSAAAAAPAKKAPAKKAPPKKAAAAAKK